MWLRRLVGLVMIVTCIGMNALVLVGFFTPDKTSNVNLVGPTLVAVVPAPQVTISAKPDAITAGSFSALSWTSTGNPTSCSAEGSWDGVKTQYGSESTGRISSPGNYTYTLTCVNKGGSNKASAVIAVGAAVVPKSPVVPKSITVSNVSYCGGSSPCYGPKDVAAHGISGNCWGWNVDRVYNISQLDSGFHKARSNITSIEISQVCGKDLAPSLGGQVSAGGQTRDHNGTSKLNADRNEIPYFVGFFDAKKP